MLKRIILLIFATLTYAAEITNIQVQQRTDGSGIIDVTYDLIDSEETYPSFNISIEMSVDGAEYSALNSGDLSGDIGENVIPGVSRSIQIEAPEDTYSNNVIIKIIASATVVSGELPFTMISISSIEGVSSYQEETINYNFQMMQYELTNADLVTFLETYEFQLDENEDPVYNCTDYTQYFYTVNNQSAQCTDDSALNYGSDVDCVYDWQVGCTDSYAYNYDPEKLYFDCTCYYSGTSYSEHVEGLTGGCNWSDVGYNDGAGSGGGTGSFWYIDVNNDDQYDFMAQQDHRIVIGGCDDSNASNYPIDFIQFFNENNIDPDCYTIQEDGLNSCEYDCNDAYLGNYNDDSANYGTANITDFSTQHISYEGLSFVIESGTGSKPALLDYNSCVDGVIVSLLLEYYGLRFPTAGEWTKAARQDNDRCWPWMNTNCSTANEAYCSSEYQCLSDEDFDACQENVSEEQLNCNNACVLENDSCETDCGCDMSGGDGSDNDCDDYNDSDDIEGCNNDEDCTYFSDSCVSSCYGCMMQPDTYEYCIGDTSGGDNANPCNEGCPCCSTCDMSGGGSSCDEDCLTQCQLDQNTCYNDCNDYSNSWEICGGEEKQDCENSYNSCTDYNQTWRECEGIQQDNLSQLLEAPSEYHEFGFLSTIYVNKFHNIYEGNFAESWDNETLDLSDVGLYPNGLSPFGLYDMIGNAPEIIKHNNLLWLIGPTPYSSEVLSFCGNDGDMFSESSSYNSIGRILSNYQGTNFNLYGLRLARTSQ